ncbi:MAG: transposase [Clostridia bacterium]|nr:transposase [Clostridia bacterium]
MKCERCKIEKEQIKAGKTKAGSQNYKCKVCGKVYTPNPKERNYSEEVKKQAIKLYMEGNSVRAVGRILGISKNICLYWIKKYAKKIQPKNRANERVEVIEMDELYSFVERKKQNLRNDISK